MLLKVPEDEVDRMHVRDNIKAVQTISRKRANVIESTLLHWRARLRSKPQKHQAPVTLRKPRQRVKSEANWQLFYYKLAVTEDVHGYIAMFSFVKSHTTDYIQLLFIFVYMKNH